jgi:transcriptional regulator with XRE-family HTH domain
MSTNFYMEKQKMELQINPKFKDAMPPLCREEYEYLKDSLKADGCRDTIIVWNGVIVDGHNRYEICKEFDMPFRIFEKAFSDEDEVVEWIMRNQLARRNLPDVERGRMVLKLKESFAARAKDNCSLGGGDKKSEIAKSGSPILVNPILKIDTQKELARIAGLSHGTLCKIEKVDNEAPAPIREAMGKTISIDKAARFNSLLKDIPESERDAEAERLIIQEFEEKEEQILREEKIAKVLCNIISAATINYEYLTAECVEIYLKKSPSSILQLVGDINHEIGLLTQLKELFLQAGGIEEEEDE